jgi:quercetin dioxygenase-like cupin family protein
MPEFVKATEINREEFDWGVIGWRCTPGAGGGTQLVVMDVEVRPGAGHNFHRHPAQEEVIIVSSGEIEQWLGESSTVLAPGDSAFVDAGLVHASFNRGPETARLTVVIGPSAATPSGYEVEDVSGQQPWASLREGRTSSDE